MLNHNFLNVHFFLSFFFLVKFLWQQVIHPPMHLIQITTYEDKVATPTTYSWDMESTYDLISA